MSHVFSPARGRPPHVTLTCAFPEGPQWPFPGPAIDGGLGPGVHCLAPRREEEVPAVVGSEVRGPAQMGGSRAGWAGVLTVSRPHTVPRPRGPQAACEAASGVPGLSKGV